jgi:hypothetical protein
MRLEISLALFEFVLYLPETDMLITMNNDTLFAEAAHAASVVTALAGRCAR